MSDDKKPPSVNDQIALYVLHERVNELKEAHQKKEDRDLKLILQITESQKALSERLIAVETNNLHISDAIVKLQKDSSLQTKLLTGILLSAVGALVTILVKALIGI